jgi:hypothetical protein
MAGLTTVTGGGIADGTITNADISPSAAIDASKVNGAGDKIEEGNSSVEVIDTGTDGRIEFDTQGSQRMEIASDGAIRMSNSVLAQSTGTHSQNAVLSVQGSRNNNASASILALVRGETTTNVGSGETLGRIVFADREAGEYAYIEGEADATAAASDFPGRLSFSVTADGESAPTERMRIHNGGVVSIPNGIELGSGLDATAVNTLDDYEEGTWTPTISNNGFTYTYSTQEGVYTKIGRLVTLRFRIVVTARSGSASGGHPVINVPINTDGLNDDGNPNFAMPSELVVHKAGTSSSSGTITLLFGGFANGATTFFFINNPTSSTATPFDFGADFNLGGVITYTSNN